MNKVEKTSKALYYFFRALMWLTPLGLIVTLFINQEVLFHIGIYRDVIDISKVYQPGAFTFGHRLIVTLVSAIPLGISTLLFYNLSCLFQLFHKGILFDNKNISLIRRIGYLMVAGELIWPLYQAMQSYSLTYMNPPTKKLIMISLGTSNIGTIVTGIIIILASWIIMEAQKLQHDAQLTI